MESSQTGSTVLIRPAERRDGDAVYAFLCELEHHPLDPIAFGAVFRRNLTDAGIYYLVAELANQPVGFVSCHVQYLLHHAGRVGEIQELFVAEPHRNQRVGRQLIAALDALAHQQGLINLEVTTNRTRTEAHRFYEQLGFESTHQKFVKHYPTQRGSEHELF